MKLEAPGLHDPVCSKAHGEPGSSPRLWQAGLLVGALLACWPAACSPRPTPPTAGRPHLERVELRPERARELPALAEIAKFVPPSDYTHEQAAELGWENDATASGVMAVEVGDTELPTLILRGKKKKRLLLRGDFDPSKFNTILVQMSLKERQDVIVLCRRGGKPLANSLGLSVPPERGHLQLFDLPSLHTVRANFDEILIKFNSDKGEVGIHSIGLLQRPYASYLPVAAADGSGAELIENDRFDRELRRGVGLSTQAALTGSFQNVARGELHYSWCVPAHLRQRYPLTLNVEVAGSDGSSSSATHKIKQDPGPEWREGSVSLEGIEGERAHVRVSLEGPEDLPGGDKELICAFAEPRVIVGGKEAKAVLVISSDTHRADHMGIVGPDAPVHTPFLNALAARGVYFDNCLTATNVTNPSHVSLLTAVHVRDTRITNNHSPLIAQAETLAERFEASGYRTFAALSANHLVHVESGLGQGFDRMNAPQKPERDAEETIDILLDWMEQDVGQNVFVWLHLFDAHAPYSPPKPFDRKYYDADKNPYDQSNKLTGVTVALPPFLTGLTDVDFPYQQYRAEVDYLDQQLGRVLEHPMFEAGIVGFTADHGEAFGEHGVFWDHAELYPTTVHVPMAVAWPGAPAGTRTKAPVRQLDLGRTLLNLAGLEDAPYPGRDLRWAVDSPTDTEPRFLISAHGFSAAINSGHWHLILHLRAHHQIAITHRREAHQVELYNLQDDPNCLNDLVDGEFERAKRMREKLIDWLNSASASALGSAATTLSSDSAAGLEALGYGGVSDDEPTGTMWFEEDPENPWDERFQ